VSLPVNNDRFLVRLWVRRAGGGHDREHRDVFAHDCADALRQAGVDRGGLDDVERVEVIHRTYGYSADLRP